MGEAVGAVRLADPDSVFAGAGVLAREATKLRDQLRKWSGLLLG